MTVSPVRLNHAVLFVADLTRAEDFYTTTFGMDLVSHEPRMNATFLRLPRSGNHHDLGLFGVAGAIPRPPRSVGLYHLAWQLDTVDELVEFRELLITSGAYTGESSHGATKSVYGIDPDGNQFEVMWMLPREQWGRYGNAAVVERLDLAAELGTWSQWHTAGDLTYATAPSNAARSTAPTTDMEQ
ncbi:MAG: VOC family protein [Mycobacterium sp.]